MYGKSQDDIQMERPRKEVTTSSEQDSQQTYLELVNNYSGKLIRMTWNVTGVCGAAAIKGDQGMRASFQKSFKLAYKLCIILHTPIEGCFCI